jgi:hypothetical protein
MKPEQGRNQAVTQVKGLSPEKLLLREADVLHVDGRQQKDGTAKGEVPAFLAGSETTAWDQEDNPGTWETQDVAQKSGQRRNEL